MSEKLYSDYKYRLDWFERVLIIIAMLLVAWAFVFSVNGYSVWKEPMTTDGLVVSRAICENEGLDIVLYRNKWTDEVYSVQCEPYESEEED